MKKTLRFIAAILSALMVLSVFTVLPLSVSAACTHENYSWNTEREADCSTKTDGIKNKFCWDCGTILETIVIRWYDSHDFNKEVLKKAPTCNEEGIVRYLCTKCGEDEGYDYHKPTIHEQILNGVNDEHAVWKTGIPATCTKDGERELHCNVCGLLLKTESIDATGHDFSNNAEYCLNGCGVKNPNPLIELKGVGLKCGVKLDYNTEESGMDLIIGDGGDVVGEGCKKENSSDLRYYEYGNFKRADSEGYIDPERDYYIRFSVEPKEGYCFPKSVKTCTSYTPLNSLGSFPVTYDGKVRDDGYIKYTAGDPDCIEILIRPDFEDTFVTETLSDGTLRIKRYNGADKDLVIPEEIDGKKITEIGESAFKENPWLETVTIPDTVKVIGEIAFAQTLRLKSVTIPDSVESIGESAFEECISLETVVLGKGLKTLGEFVFYYCKALKKVVIPDGLTVIGAKMFKSCDALEEITIPDSVTKIGEYAFGYDYALTSVKLGSGITKISDYLFFGCDALEEITIPDNIIEIGEYAFGSCVKLGKVSFGDNPKLARIHRFAFAAAGLKSFYIPESVIMIDEGAFVDSNIERQAIPASVQKIGANAFGYRYSGYNEIPVENFTILGENDTVAETYAKDNGFKFMGEYEYNLTDDGEGTVITKYNGNSSTVKIPSKLGGKKVVLIGADSFARNESITEVSFKGAPDIDGYAFRDCPNLKSVMISASNMIGECAFQNCASLEKIGFDNRVSTKEIGNFAFFNCPSLKTVNIEMFVQKIGIFAFGYIDPNTKVDGFKLIVRDDRDNEGLFYAKQNGFYVEPTTAATEAAESTTAAVTADATSETKTTEPAETTAPESSKSTEPAESTAPDFSKPTDPAETTEPDTGETKTPHSEETTAPAKTQTFSYIPSKEQQSGTIKAVVLDKGGQYHAFTMTASPMIVDGTPVYSVEIPADITPVSVQYQFFDGDTWKSQITLTPEHFGKIVTFDGKIYGETPATEATTSALTTEPATKAPAVVSEKKDNPFKVKVTAAKKVSLKKLKKKAQTAATFKVTGAKGKLSFKIKSAKKAIKKYLSISKKGVLSVKKWKKAKKGAYTIKVSITAKGNADYNSKTVNKSVKIKLK